MYGQNQYVGFYRNTNCLLFPFQNHFQTKNQGKCQTRLKNSRVQPQLRGVGATEEREETRKTPIYK